MSLVRAINEGWGWSGVIAAKVHAHSPMGHLLFTDEEGCFHYLDTDGMKLIMLGDQQAVDAYFADEEARDLWQASGLVETARRRLGAPPEGSVFTLKPHALIEGNYSPDEMCILSIEELVRLSGDLTRQIKDLPDGARIQLKIVD